MTRLVPLLALLPALALAAGSAKSKKEEQPPSGIVYSTSELSRTSFRCLFIDNDRDEAIQLQPTNFIKCEFTQLSVWGPDNADEEAAKALKDFDENWRKAPEAERTQMLSKLKAECTPKAKADLAKYRNEGLTKASKHPRFAALRPALATDMAQLDKMCGCSDVVCIRSMVEQEARDKAARCTLNANRYDMVFKRDFQAGGWVNIQTDANCYASITTTLAHPADGKDDFFWNMRTIRVPRANPTGMFCKGVKLEATEDLWTGWGEWIEPQCKQFRFF